MKGGTRKSPIATLVALALVGTALHACSTEQPQPVPPSPPQAEGIPGPDASLNDSSPVTAFLRYGDSLRFAADTPGAVTAIRTAGGVTSELRVRSEVRLRNTTESAYAQGRIIAKLETMRGTSGYGTPIGNAYLWVRDTGGGNFRGTLMWQNYVTGQTGRVQVAQQIHSSPRSGVGDQADCMSLSASSDTTRTCCLCWDGRMNCFFSEAMTAGQLDSLLTINGFPARSP